MKAETKFDVAGVLADLNVSGWRTERGHDCDGTDEVCAIRCPVAVQVGVLPDELAAAISAHIAETLTSSDARVSVGMAIWRDDRPCLDAGHLRRCCAGCCGRLAGRRGGTVSGVGVVALRAAAEAANHGPWEAESETVWQVDLDGQPNMVATRAFEPDAVFIAAANPTVVLALLDRVSELEAAVERVARRMEGLRQSNPINGDGSNLMLTKALNVLVGEFPECLAVVRDEQIAIQAERDEQYARMRREDEAARTGAREASTADLSDFQADDVQGPTPSDDERDNEEIR